MKKSNVTSTTTTTTTIQVVEPTRLKLLRANGSIPGFSIGRVLTLVPTTSTVPFSIPKLRARPLKPCIVGKGRFGKRPASFSIDYGHINDNSNDSGLECDNSNSDSQFWGSSEDLRMVGRTTSNVVVGNRQIVIPQFQTSNSNPEVDLRKTQTIFVPSSCETVTLLEQVAPISNPPFEGKKIVSEIITPNPPVVTSEGKSMSPDSTCTVEENGINTTSVTTTMKPPSSLSFGNPKSYGPSSVKRSRFNFQTPGNPVRPASGLRLRNQNQSNGTTVRGSLGKRLPPGTPPTLSSPITANSRDGRVQLHIIAQPEEQHRARYQTEGSRGAIKDRKGNGFPAVKLVGYDKPATLQIFIGSDQGKVSPHMFYQACKVTGKSSTPCVEKKVEGTILIEIEFEPSKDMAISCDCVGILKERNVDVEQRFPFHHAASSRKKSTRCRLIFRTTIINSEGIQETLQVSSLPILCTQPPGQPEICKKSLAECYCSGGQELFIVGKNFLKDTKVVVQEETTQGELLWEAKADILKDYLQQNHLICVLPPYKNVNILKPVDCKVAVWSGGKLSEPHHITYLPNQTQNVFGPPATTTSCVSSVVVNTQQIQSQSLNQNNLQLASSMLSVDIPMSGGPLLTSNDSMASNSFMNESGGIGQVDMIQSPANMNSVTSMSFENSMLNPASASPEERQVVSELQEILDQSSQHTMMSIGETKPNLTLGPTSFFGLNLAAPGEVSQPFTQSSSPIHTSTISQSNSSPVALFSDVSHHDMSSQHSNASMSPFESTTSCVTTMPQMLVMDQQSETQLLCSTPTTTAENVMNCLNQALKPEPVSPRIVETTCIQQEPIPNNPQMMNVINFMGGDLHGEQRSIANALTQLSDNELLSYINPSCFEQDVK